MAGAQRSRTAVTMSDVGRVAGVSSTTVSHVINSTRYIAPATRQAVLDAIRATGYVGDGIARSLRTGTTQSIGLAMSALSNPYFAAFVHAIEKEISRSGFSLVLADTHDDAEREGRAVAEILSHRVDAMILAPAAGSGPVLDLLTERDVPTMIVDRIPTAAPRPGTDAIGIENAEPTALLVDHLAELGHRRIALVAPSTGLSTIDERLAGYRDGLRRNGIEPDDDLVVMGDATDLAAVSLDAVLGLAEPPSALVSGNNEMTIGIMRELRRTGLEVPDDIALVCFDDFDWADLFHPRLTAMAQPADEIGRRAVEMLFERIANPELEPRTVRVPPRFMHRESCGTSSLHRMRGVSA